MLALGLATPAAAAADPDPDGVEAKVSRVTAAQLGASHHDGCPVPPDRLRKIEMNHWGFDGKVHRGTMVVRDDMVKPVTAVFEAAFDARFPIRKMRPASEYGGSDEKAMADDNTSAFNCRQVTGVPGRMSQHSYGNAVDINPLENPYVDANGVIHPPASRGYLDRGQDKPGMIKYGDAVWSAMRAQGWLWGGRWHHPDYQHFSSNGG
ncbi:M15 family metallopeptidase [Streptomyces sp. A7024]|uniref:M15 family metallopeptidase n=1 Tax=Streptomyces coryli TaxID=1128680 RepID=A0A6G4TSN3_9ACTN|nr:M15 family metallopeptidase [Streptomyces coryli]NGN63029.1 M15 family metallopeptidase [Streptomyces coryli]